MVRNYKTIFGEKVFLPDEKWEHIIHKHPEAKRYGKRIREVLGFPDIVKISRRDPGIHLYYKFYEDIFSGKYLLVVVNDRKKSLATMFVTDKIKVGEVLWERK